MEIKSVPSLARVVILLSTITMPASLVQAQQSSFRETHWPSANVSGMEEDYATAAPRSTLPDDATSACTLRLPEPAPGSSSRNETSDSVSAPIPFHPLSPGCKFHLVLQQTYSPYTFASAGFQSIWDQAEGRWPHYGGGVQGWGKRFGAGLADTDARRFIQGFALSTLLHQDPRYFPSHKRALVSRAWYAATRVLVVRTDDGHSTFNSSEFIGALLASAVQNSYYPTHDRTFADTMNRYGGALGSDAITNLLREFTPDMKRLFRRHAPTGIQKIERKLPIPAEDKL